MCGELFAKQSKVILLQSGRGQGGIGIEEAAKLVDDIVALQRKISYEYGHALAFV